MPPKPDSGEGDPRVIIAQCTDCRSSYVAQKWADGTIRPRGKRAGCGCGCTTFIDLTISGGNRCTDSNAEPHEGDGNFKLW